MKNHLAYIEDNLRSIAKRYKNIKFSLGMVILFLMMGVGAFSEEVENTSIAQRENIKNSVENLNSKLKDFKLENQKQSKGLRLELIQLMEQGDQVVKSPWASWQFGANYMYSKWNGRYKGNGDKSEKYAFEGMFIRGQWWENNVSPDSKAYSKLEVSSSGRNSSLTNKRKSLDYGLVGTCCR